MPWTNPLWRRLQALTQSRHRTTIVVVLLIGGVVVSGIAALTVERANTAHRQEIIDNELRTVAARVDRAAARAVDTLESMRPLWRLRPDATDADFKEYLASGFAVRRNGVTTYDSLSDIAFIRAVDRGEGSAFADARRRERPQRYDIDLDDDSAHYVVDFHSGDAILGTDVYPLDNRRVALDAARDGGTTVATQWYTTVSDLQLPADQQRRILLVAVPVYTTGVPPATIAQRRSQLIGWLVTPLFADQLLEQLAANRPYALTMFDGDSTQGRQVGMIGEPADAVLRDAVAVSVLGRDWTIEVGLPAAAVTASPVRWPLVLGAGLLFNSLLTALVWATSRLGQRSEHLASSAFAQLRERETYLRVITEHVTVGIADLDVEGRIAWANHQVADLLDSDAVAVLGTTWSELVHADDRDTVVAALTGAVNAEQPVDIRHRLAGGDGERWVEMAGAPITDGYGEVSRVVAVLTDVSAMVELEAQLRLARDNAVEASRLKSEFLANMSHEIRTPLNGVIGMADVLYRADLTPSQRSKLATLRTAAVQLRDLLNDILDLSKIEAGRLEVDSTEFDLVEAVSSIAQFHASQAFDAGLTLRVDLDDALPQHLIGPPLRLRQVLNNLLGNAIKFTENGEVRLSVRRLGTDNDTVRVAFEVADTGIGIPSAVLDTIFDPFTQADTSDTRAYGGTGLGLAISRQLVAMMGGELMVASVDHEGSTFSFVLELSIAPAPAVPAGDQSLLPPAVPISGADTSQVTTTAAALTASAADTSDQADAGRTAGAVDATGGSAARAGAESSRTATLLIVEDNPINQEVARELLASLGYETEVAHDGADGVDAVKARRFDAILMDCQMPGMDGYEATARIRTFEEPKGRHTPIIAMTASAMVGDRQRCLAAGMDDYIAKPVSVTILAETIERWVTGETTAAPSTTAETDDDDAQPPVIDWQMLHQLSVVPGLLERSRTKYLENGVLELAQLRQLVTDGDFDQVGSIAHKFKGASLTIGAARLGDRLQKIELAANDRSDATVELLDGLEECFADVREALLTTDTV
ncbi:hypothetical protein BH23ACT10_BH23ACT10_09280 [soil metagenome]